MQQLMFDFAAHPENPGLRLCLPPPEIKNKTKEKPNLSDGV